MALVVPHSKAGLMIGVVSDTHGYLDPFLPDRLKGVAAILHAGDVGSQEVLDALRSIAPVYAVRGNVDGSELLLPPSAELDFGGLRIEMTHILPVAQTELEAWSKAVLEGVKAPKSCDRFLATFKEQTDVIIFGHSHSPCLIGLGDKLFFNPGSAGKKRFSLPRSYGVLHVAKDNVSASIISLEEDCRKLSAFELERPGFMFQSA